MLTTRSTVMCSTFARDTTLVALQSFSLLKTSTSLVTIVLTFAKPVAISTFNCTDFIFKSDNTLTPAQTLMFQRSDCTVETTVNANAVTFTVPSSRFSGGVIGVAQASSWVFVPHTGTTADIYGNNVAPVSATSSVRQGPQLVKYVLDMNQGVLTMVFSNTIERTGPFNPSSLGLYSMVTGQSATLAPSNKTLLGPLFRSSPVNDSFAVITLSAYDFISIQLIDVENSLVCILVGERTLLDVSLLNRFRLYIFLYHG